MAASSFAQKLSQDVRYALRQMRRAPGFALVTVLTLALGVGAAAAVFSVMDAVLIRPLPFNHPERILLTATRSASGYTQPFSFPDFRDLRNSMPGTLDAFAGFENSNASLQLPSGPLSVTAERSSDNLFRVLGVQPLLGRTFLPGEDETGRNDIVVLGYDVWRTTFNADPSIVGRTVSLDGKPTVVVGVMPAGFRFPLSVRNAIYTPFHNERKTWAPKRGSHWMPGVVRLKPGVTEAQALAEFSTRMADLARQYPDTDAGRKAGYITLAKATLGDTSTGLWALGGAVAALLLIACVNVAGLLLARAVRREREWALRYAVGASRGRMLLQLLTESALLGLLSSVVGVALAYGLTTVMRTYLIKSLSRGADVHVNAAVLLVAVACAVLTAVVASLLPALGLLRLQPNQVLKAGGGAGTQRARAQLRAGFIVAQVCLSLALLVVSGLLLQVLQRTRSEDLGFDPTHLLTVRLDLAAGRYAGRDPVANFYQPLLDRLQHTPGVVAAGLIDVVPVQSWGSNMDTHITGQPPALPTAETLSEVRLVSAGYYKALGLPLLQGRMFDPALDSSETHAPGMVVNQAFVHKFIPAGMDPIGQRIDDNDKDAQKSTIIGVVGNARQTLQQAPMAELGWLIDRMPQEFRVALLSMSLVVRTAGDPRAVLPTVASVLHSVDPTVPLRDPETMRDVIEDQLVFQRMEGWLFGLFAVVAVLLAMAGLYGLVSQEVESGTRDIGVRMALGATRGHVLLRVLRRMAALVGTGAVLGLLLTVAARRSMNAMVQMQPSRDAPLLAGLALGVVLLALLVSLFPARRAASLDPVQALRAE